MKKYFLLALAFLSLSMLINSCGKEKQEGKQGDVPYSPDRDQSIQSYNIDVKKDQVKRTPCDTIALREYVLKNYPAGSYLVQFDRTNTYNVPRYAVLYHNAEARYVFAVIARSKPGERLIETKNIIGYESSFINLDSTKLGTAFFYLTCFQCMDSSFSMIWEKEIPIHGGFNAMTYKIWKPRYPVNVKNKTYFKNTPYVPNNPNVQSSSRLREATVVPTLEKLHDIPYIELNYEDGIIVGHRNYNVFMCNGLKEFPHLLETYEGLSRKRTMGNINNDNYPDYYEFFFYHTNSLIGSVDSVGFIWDLKRNLYVNTRNRNQTRFY